MKCQMIVLNHVPAVSEILSILLSFEFYLSRYSGYCGIIRPHEPELAALYQRR